MNKKSKKSKKKALIVVRDQLDVDIVDDLTKTIKSTTTLLKSRPLLVEDLLLARSALKTVRKTLKLIAEDAIYTHKEQGL